ncbi:SubName: Full=Uncharacterized protein {ECO:0000313/EMBL:CCA73767.1} [Serendipita indica DSM 11827]|uniref:Uncharacterized protein n=1 Tax=Serendipita indica (strain DSM 11827) TaxID=1109443 RepID=G4TR23_SERID|nr:SubName: Full=Uncharacterized protein {ECO:0000313/EMBL:CCA73767.1} [Serendipita indica DSM 11827]CCA73767.1 hypothetical protein PIIN_07722 [Serendipita indica DSM 11827]
MLQSIDTTAWLTSVSRRKLQQAAGSLDRSRDADKLLRKVLLRNSITRGDLPFAEALPSQSSPPSPTLASPQQPPLPLASTASPVVPRTDEDDFVFPDATSLTASRVYSSEDADAEAKWLDSLLEDLSDDEYDDTTKAGASHKMYGEEEEGEDDLDLDWLLSNTFDEPQPISVPAPLPPREPIVLEDLRPFHYPLPEDDDDDLSTAPGMEEDVEGESEADSVEWPLTPGAYRSITSILGRSTSSSNLNQLVASAGRDDNAGLPSITEGAVYDNSARPAIHVVEETPLYRYSPAPREHALSASTTPALGPSC